MFIWPVDWLVRVSGFVMEMLNLRHKEEKVYLVTIIVSVWWGWNPFQPDGQPKGPIMWVSISAGETAWNCPNKSINDFQNGAVLLKCAHLRKREAIPSSSSSSEDCIKACWTLPAGGEWIAATKGTPLYWIIKDGVSSTVEVAKAPFSWCHERVSPLKQLRLRCRERERERGRKPDWLLCNRDHSLWFS